MIHRIKYSMYYFEPDEPNPPAPLSVSSNSFTSINLAGRKGRIIS